MGTPTLFEQNDFWGFFEDHIAVDNQGDAVAVWGTRGLDNEFVHVARFASGAWNPYEEIVSVFQTYIDDTHVAIDNNGNILVILGGGRHILCRIPGRSLECRRQTDGRCRLGIQIAMDPSGNAFAVWGGGDIFARRFTSGSWGPVTLLDTGIGDANNPQVAMDNNGNIVVVWQQKVGQIHSIYAKRYSSRYWGRSRHWILERGMPTDPQVAMDNNGNAIVVAAYDGAHDSVYARRFAGSSWGPVTLLESGTGTPGVLRYRLDDNGNAMVVWQQFDVSGHLSLYAKRFSAGAWGPVTLLETGTGDVWSPQIAMDDNGNGLVVWQQYDSSAHLSLYSKRFSAGAWGPVMLMENTAGSVWGPRVCHGRPRQSHGGLAPV